MSSSTLFEGHGTGAQKLLPDWRDFQVVRHPGIAAALSSFPDTYSLRQYQTGPALDQGQTGACVAASSSHVQALYEQMERKQWITFDWATLYAENGGSGDSGVNSRDVLQDMQTRGCPVLSSSDRYEISAYAFVDFSNFDLAIQTVKAAIFAKHPLVLAMLLPSDFMNGMTAGAAGSVVTSGYHQVMLGEYTSDRFGFLNSWGPFYGVNGWGSVPTEYLRRREQNGYLYAFTTLDAVDPVPAPLPTPVPTPSVLTIKKIKYKNAHHLIVTGVGFQADSQFSLDGRVIFPLLSDLTETRFEYIVNGLIKGSHTVSIVNPDGAGVQKGFTVG